MDKTLGQVAMETFAKHIRSDGSYPDWAGHTPESKSAWEATAVAVFRSMQRRYAVDPRLRDNWMDEADRFGLFDNRANAERAVIEAAVALRKHG